MSKRKQIPGLDLFYTDAPAIVVSVMDGFPDEIQIEVGNPADVVEIHVGQVDMLIGMLRTAKKAARL